MWQKQGEVEMKQHDSREKEKKKGPRVRQNGITGEVQSSLQGIFKVCPPGHGHYSRSRFSSNRLHRWHVSHGSILIWIINSRKTQCLRKHLLLIPSLLLYFMLCKWENISMCYLSSCVKKSGWIYNFILVKAGKSNLVFLPLAQFSLV